MKKVIAVVVAFFAVLVLASCGEPASEDEIRQMCEKLGDLSAKAGTPAEAKAKLDQVTGEHDAKVAKLEAEKKETLDRIAAEESAALAEMDIQKTVERAAIVADFAKRTSDKTLELDAKVKPAILERDEMVKKAQEALDTAEADWNEIVFKCTSDNAGASKPAAQCRIKAASKTAWEECD